MYHQKSIYPELFEPEPTEDLSYWNWGTLLPDKPEILIGEGNGWAAYKRGVFEDYSIVFPVTSKGVSPPVGHKGIHPTGWKSRIVEVYPDHTVEIIPEDTPEIALMQVRKLEDGTYIYTVGGQGGEDPNMPKGLGQIDSNGKNIRKLINKAISHEGIILPNGHILVCSPNPPHGGVAREIDWEGNVYWKWDQNDFVPSPSYQKMLEKNPYAVEHFKDPLEGVDKINPGSHLGVNAVQALPNGHHLISYRNADLIFEADENNEVVWSFGPMVIKHQHCPTLLDNGNILIHDTFNYRAIEVTRDHKIVWEFDKGMPSHNCGTVQRLPNGNTLITDSYRTINFCVSPDGEVIWEVYIKGKDTITRTEALKRQDVVIPGLRLYRAWAYPIGFGK
jgi:hypothetical protein